MNSLPDDFVTSNIWWKNVWCMSVLHSWFYLFLPVFNDSVLETVYCKLYYLLWIFCWLCAIVFFLSVWPWQYFVDYVLLFSSCPSVHHNILLIMCYCFLPVHLSITIFCWLCAIVFFLSVCPSQYFVDYVLLFSSCPSVHHNILLIMCYCFLPVRLSITIFCWLCAIVFFLSVCPSQKFVCYSYRFKGNSWDLHFYSVSWLKQQSTWL
jgi:hypothetical protein